jgi:signal transduction histidine kinase
VLEVTENSAPHGSMWRHWRRRLAEDTELAQSLARIAIGVVCSIYCLLGQPDMQIPLYALMAPATPWIGLTFLIASVAHSGWVALVPGHFPLRRLLALTLDMTAVALCLLMDGERVLPTFAAMVWISVGYGMRFGQRWLMLGIVFSLASLALVTALNPYWQAHPWLVATFFIIAIVAPGYSFVLFARIRTAHMELARANLEKSRFLAQASHDLHHPLRAIGLFLTHLRETPLSSLQGDIAHGIDDAVHDASELLQRFLDVSIIEAGRLVPNPVAFDLNILLRELQSQNQLAAQRMGTRLRFVRTSGWVYADRTFIKTILQNLVSNAIRHAPGATVLVGCRRRGDGLAVWVADNGPGLQESVLTHWQHDTHELVRAEPGASEGAGIGLSIVRRLAQIAGLTVSARSAGGKGTVFAVESLALSASNGVKLSSPLAGLRVAIVADEAALVEHYAQLLRRWNCLPILHQDGQALEAHDIAIVDRADPKDLHAFRLMASTHPALILSSLMPAVVQAIVGHVPVVVASKPVAPAELRSLLMSLRTHYAP